MIFKIKKTHTFGKYHRHILYDANPGSTSEFKIIHIGNGLYEVRVLGGKRNNELLRSDMMDKDIEELINNCYFKVKKYDDI